MGEVWRVMRSTRHPKTSDAVAEVQQPWREQLDLGLHGLSLLNAKYDDFTTRIYTAECNHNLHQVSLLAPNMLGRNRNPRDATNTIQ